MSIDYNKLISRSMKIGGALGAVGYVGGALYGGQVQEEYGASLSQQALGSLKGGVVPGAIGFGVGAGGYAVTRAMKEIFKKQV